MARIVVQIAIFEAKRADPPGSPHPELIDWDGTQTTPVGSLVICVTYSPDFAQFGIDVFKAAY